MTQNLFKVNNFLIIPLSFILLILYRKNTFYYILSLILFIAGLLIKILMNIQNFNSINYDELITNIIICAVLIYICLRILENKIPDETLLYIKKIILFSFGLFFIIENSPFLRGISSYIIAIPSVLISKIFGFSFSIEGIDYGHYLIYWQTYLEYIGEMLFEINVPIQGTNIAIVLGCTGIRELLLFFGIVNFTNAEKPLKRKVFNLILVIIITSNIIRNSVVIIFTGGRNVSFETTHHIFGGILIFITLITSFIYALIKIPEINRHIEKTFGLKPL